jgi:hypothetical protein
MPKLAYSILYNVRANTLLLKPLAEQPFLSALEHHAGPLPLSRPALAAKAGIEPSP